MGFYMAMNQTLAYVAVVAATVGTIAFLVPQISKLIRTGDSAGVSTTWAALGLVTKRRVVCLHDQPGPLGGDPGTVDHHGGVRVDHVGAGANRARSEEELSAGGGVGSAADGYGSSWRAGRHSA